MPRLLTFLIGLVFFYCSPGQDVSVRLGEALKKLETDPQLKHAIISLYVVDSKTGKQVFNKNAQIGLVPASCQKVITSTSSFELLGADYRYKTEISYDGKIEEGVLKGNLHIVGGGDPTLGSRRWESTNENQVLQRWVSEIKKAGIKKVEGIIFGDQKNWSTATVPDGWIWQDIGNYYGAGASSINWRENQYDITLKSGNRIGDVCEIVSIKPGSVKPALVSEVITAERGSGDNAFIYLPPGANFGYIRGTIPIGENAFVISGSLPNPSLSLVYSFSELLNSSGIAVPKQEGWISKAPFFKLNPLYTNTSLPLDSINYWFLKKSINLYGEALIKTIAWEKEGFGSTEKGVDIIKYFWSQRGIEKSALNIMDGSGLSPQNRVTTDALVKVMQYARSKPWFYAFYRALPEINGITMKSGSINGVRSYTGYVKSKNGNEYTFAIIINNFDGSAPDMVRKIWRVLDVLK
ncbi:MAG: D-alanyl-D-alanine carboxypeptidase/D-alanyl-D-alanine-endopeptidase [Chitinophagaceae bacterium]